MRRFTISSFSGPGTLQSRAVDFGFTGVATVAAREVYYLRQFTHSRFSSLGVPIVVMTRPPFTAADRSAAINASGGYLFGRPYAVPDVSGGVSVAFEEVYPI